MSDNTPILKKRSGSFSVAIFAKNMQRNDGTEYISYGAVLQKAYKDPQTNEWKNQQISMFDNNMPEVALLLQAVAMELMAIKSPAQTQPAAAQPAAQPVAAPAAAAQPMMDLNDDCPF